MTMLAALLWLAAASAEPGHEHHQPQLGKLVFDTSCASQADRQVQLGLRWLHSFQYPQAERTFAAAAAADPQCAIAHWGVAMSQYHPLWAPPTADELRKGKTAMEAAKAATSGNARERAYIAALDVFYRDADAVDHKTRALAYSDAMASLHQRFPQDHEAATFYALSLIAAGTFDNDPEFMREKRAGAILNGVLAENPGHPGVAHYLIHNFDYPPLAPLALEAARRYAGIAPDSPHAQHMPSHIFVRLGLWDEAIKSNIASAASAQSHAKALGLPDSSSERLHAMDYLVYGYLQTGQDRQAERVLAELKSIRRADPPVFTVAYAATAIPARLLLERRRWREAATLELPDSVRALAPLGDFRWGEGHVHFARAIGAARTGDVAAAATEIAQLNSIEQALTVPPGSYDWRTQVAIQRQVAQAWLAYAQGREAESAQIMRAAADLDDATEKHPVTPGQILPAREQLGELLLELGKPAEALKEYEAALVRSPRRLAGLYGAARAAKAAGDGGKAKFFYAQLVAVTKDGDIERAEIREARAHAPPTAP